jgi:hypothetical protein
MCQLVARVAWISKQTEAGTGSALSLVAGHIHVVLA